MNPIELGKFIASLRNEKNLTQEELAEMLYIDKRKISRWECGNSIPEFEMLIKLSEILNVSLYELSICHRIENESLTRKTINKFKSIKDFKKYKFRKKLKIILLIIFFILFTITATYTIKHNDTVEIYKLESTDDNYYLDGTYMQIKDSTFFYIKRFNAISKDNNKEKYNFDSCEYKAINSDGRLLHMISDGSVHNNFTHQALYHETREKIDINQKIDFQITCKDSNNAYNTFSFNVKFTRIYENKLF